MYTVARVAPADWKNPRVARSFNAFERSGGWIYDISFYGSMSVWTIDNDEPGRQNQISIKLRLFSNF
jgi:hypothetical protein